MFAQLAYWLTKVANPAGQVGNSAVGTLCRNMMSRKPSSLSAKWVFASLTSSNDRYNLRKLLGDGVYLLGARQLGATITVLNYSEWNEEEYPDTRSVSCDCNCSGSIDLLAATPYSARSKPEFEGFKPDSRLSSMLLSTHAGVLPQSPFPEPAIEQEKGDRPAQHHQQTPPDIHWQTD